MWAGPQAAPALRETSWAQGRDGHTLSPPTNAAECLGGQVGGSLCERLWTPPLKAPCEPAWEERQPAGQDRPSQAKHESYWVWMGPGTYHSPGWHLSLNQGGRLKLSRQSLVGHLALPPTYHVSWACDFLLGVPVSSSVNNEKWTYGVKWMKCSHEMRRTGWGPVKCLCVYRLWIRAP